MKKLIIFMVIFSAVLIAQRTETSKFSLKVKYENNKSGGFAASTQNENGFLTSVIYGNDSLALGVMSHLHVFYLNSFSDNYWSYIKGDISQTARNGSEEKATKMIIYSFYPKRTLTDTILVYCKYITYTLKSIKAPDDYNYDVVYSEEFIKVLLNEEVKVSFIQSQFPKSKVSLKIIAGEEDFEKIQVVDKSPYPFEESKIRDLAKKSQISAKEISFGIDLVRTNRNGNQIILKRTDFPLKSFSVNTGSESVGDVKTLYYGFIEVPFQIYNLEKMELFDQSNKSRNKSFYSVYIIPIAKEKNSYSLELIISQGDNSGNYSYSKKLDLPVGEKINIELQPDNWRYEEVVRGEKLKLNSEEDYNKYVKDYLILSLEEGVINNESKSLSSNRETNTKAKYVETRTQADYERMSLGNELHTLATHAVNFCYSSKRNIKSWDIPEAYRKNGFIIYRLTDIVNGIEIEAVGRAIGNDKVTPVRSVVKVTSQRKSTTHYVKSGESVSTIAKKYGVSVQQIKSRNNLKSNRFSVGQKLIIDEPFSRNNLVISQVEVKN